MKFTSFKTIIAAAVALAPASSWAYQMDVHFNLTYVLCRLGGLDSSNSLWIAAADHSMDTNRCTTAFLNVRDAWDQAQGAGSAVYIKTGTKWHAFSDVSATDETTLCKLPALTEYRDGGASARAAIAARRRTLWDQIPAAFPKDDDPTRITTNIALGQYLHFLEDTYAHRQLNSNATDDHLFTPYAPEFGHLVDSTKPDEVAGRPKLAVRMLMEVYHDIQKFTKAHGVTGGVSLSEIDATNIIKNLAQVYPRTPPVSNKNLGRLGETGALVLGFPGQTEVTQALRRALVEIGKSNVIEEQLPEFRDSFSLPYDKPETPFDVEQKLIHL